MKALPYPLVLLLAMALSACGEGGTDAEEQGKTLPPAAADSLQLPQVVPEQPGGVFDFPQGPQTLPPYSPKDERPPKPGEDPDAVSV
jgi:hypothetical protein